MRPDFGVTLRRGAQDWLLNHLTFYLPLVEQWCSTISISKVPTKKVRHGIYLSVCCLVEPLPLHSAVALHGTTVLHGTEGLRGTGDAAGGG